jgi:rhodanese-related sulfurtransferase
MQKKGNNIFHQLQIFESEINRLEGRVLELEQRMEQMFEIERNHLIRVKNKEQVPDDFILSAKKYLDLTPEKAWRLYNNKDFDFILLDVSSKDHSSQHKLPEAIHIPWEDFSNRFMEIQSRSTPILVISEDGTTSVLACEFLAKRGYFNCNNISGGYKHWRGFRLAESQGESA